VPEQPESARAAKAATATTAITIAYRRVVPKSRTSADQFRNARRRAAPSALRRRPVSS
jgi:hypothetical protein